MNYETLNIFEYNGYLTGKITASKQPYSETYFQKIKNWKADIIVIMASTEVFETYDFAIKILNYFLHWLHAVVTNFDNPNNSFNKIIFTPVKYLKSKRTYFDTLQNWRKLFWNDGNALTSRARVKANSGAQTGTKIRPLAIDTEA